MNPTRDPILEQLIREEWPERRRFFRTKTPDAGALDLDQGTLLAFVEGRSRAKTSERAYRWGIAHYERHRAATPFDSSIHTAIDLGPSLGIRLDGRSRRLRALRTAQERLRDLLGADAETAGTAYIRL